MAHKQIKIERISLLILRHNNIFRNSQTLRRVIIVGSRFGFMFFYVTLLHIYCLPGFLCACLPAWLLLLLGFLLYMRRWWCWRRQWRVTTARFMTFEFVATVGVLLCRENRRRDFSPILSQRLSLHLMGYLCMQQCNFVTDLIFVFFLQWGIFF